MRARVEKSVVGSPVSRRTAAATMGKAEHSSTKAETVGSRANSPRTAATTSRSSIGTVSAGSGFAISAQLSLPSMPTTSTGRSAADQPAPLKWCSVSWVESYVTTPSLRPGGARCAINGTSSRLDSPTGIETAAATSLWNRAVKPQLVVIARAPSASSRRASSI